MYPVQIENGDMFYFEDFNAAAIFNYSVNEQKTVRLWQN